MSIKIVGFAVSVGLLTQCGDPEKVVIEKTIATSARWACVVRVATPPARGPFGRLTMTHAPITPSKGDTWVWRARAATSRLRRLVKMPRLWPRPASAAIA